MIFFFFFGICFKYSLFIIVNMIYFFINENINYLSNFFFLHDRWCGETPLVVSYPELFRFCRNKEASVDELMKFTNGVLF